MQEDEERYKDFRERGKKQHPEADLKLNLSSPIQDEIQRPFLRSHPTYDSVINSDTYNSFDNKESTNESIGRVAKGLGDLTKTLTDSLNNISYPLSWDINNTTFKMSCKVNGTYLANQNQFILPL